MGDQSESISRLYCFSQDKFCVACALVLFLLCYPAESFPRGHGIFYKIGLGSSSFHQLFTLQIQILRSEHQAKQAAVTSRGGRSLRVYKSGDQLHQHVAATHRLVYWRIYVKIYISATKFCRRNKSQKFCLTDLIFLYMLLQHNSVAETKIFTKILQYTRSN